MLMSPSVTVLQKLFNIVEEELYVDKSE